MPFINFTGNRIRKKRQKLEGKLFERKGFAILKCSMSHVQDKEKYKV